jgi:hypothetical protein
MDLRAEPLVLTVPKVEKGRYYSVMLCDGNTYNFGIIGSQATQGVPGDYMVVGPDWQGETPAGIQKVFRSTTQFAVAGYRTQLFGPADLPNVKAVQAGYKVQGLSGYLQQSTAPTAPVIDFPPANAALLKQNFFAYLDFALQFAPAAPNEQAIRTRLASIGIGNDQFERFKAIAASHPQALAAGVAAGEEKITNAIPAMGKRENGWTLMLKGGGDAARYHGDWLTRAVVAKAGIYALDASEAMYALTRNTTDGEPPRRQPAQLQHHFPGRTAAARRGLLVADHVRRQHPVAGSQPDPALPDQLAHAATLAEKRRRFPDPLYTEGFTRC